MPLVLEVAGRTWRRRCAIHCHTASRPTCDCCCGGLFHGAAGVPGQLEVLAFAYVPELLLLWTRAERRGDVRVLYARADLHGPRLVRRRGACRRPHQLPLFAPSVPTRPPEVTPDA